MKHWSMRNYIGCILQLYLSGMIPIITRYVMFVLMVPLNADLQDVLVVYGDWLFERREFRQAASGISLFWPLKCVNIPCSIRRGRLYIKSYASL